MRILVYLVAIAVIGTWMTQGSLAEEVSRDGGSTVSANPDGSRPPVPEDATGGAKLDHRHAPDGKGESKTVTGEGGQKGNSVGRDVKPAPSVDKDSDAIDTRITVPPQRPGRRDAVKEGDSKARPFARHIFRPPRSAHENPARVTRDAIGLPIGRHEGIEQGSAERHDTPALVNNPAAAPTGFGANTSGGSARPGEVFAHPLSNANPIARSSAPNRGTVNGTNLARPGAGPSSVGGPAKPVAGINGTSFRSKH